MTTYHVMKNTGFWRQALQRTSVLSLAAVTFLIQSRTLAQPDPNWLGHDRARPSPAVVAPGSPSAQDQPGKPPSDAVVLFDGKDPSQWAAMDGSPTKWVARNGALE